jgi:hypothetical protein
VDGTAGGAAAAPKEFRSRGLALWPIVPAASGTAGCTVHWGVARGRIIFRASATPDKLSESSAGPKARDQKAPEPRIRETQQVRSPRSAHRVGEDCAVPSPPLTKWRPISLPRNVRPTQRKEEEGG